MALTGRVSYIWHEQTTMAENKKKPLGKRLRSVYRLSLLRENTFEEKFFVRLTPLNLIVSTTVAFLITSLGVFFLIAATPLRELMPGHEGDGWKKDASTARKQSDSLSRVYKESEVFLKDLKLVLSGQTVLDTLKRAEVPTDVRPELIYSPSSTDSALRALISNKEKLSFVFGPKSSASSGSTLMFKPVEGVVTNHFNVKAGHFGIDIAAPENEVVKSVMDGTVLFVAWTVEDGHVIQVQHANNTVSIYKHNSVLLKQPGENVKAGDPLAIIGNSGKNTTGPHLHFELWRDRMAINPVQYLSYD